MFQTLFNYRGFNRVFGQNSLRLTNNYFPLILSNYSTANKGGRGSKAAPAAAANPTKKEKPKNPYDDLEITPYDVVDSDTGVSFGQFCDEFEDFLKTTNLPEGQEHPLLKPGDQVWTGMIGDKTQEDIYNLNKTNPQKWTVRKLANLYNTEMERIEAILCLKDIEKRLIKLGYPVDEEYTKRYEEMCGYPPYVPLDKIEEHQRNMRSKVVDPWGELKYTQKPKFKILKNEEMTMSKGLFQGAIEASKPIYENQTLEPGGKVLLKSVDKSRSKFVFTDLSKEKRGNVWVKEQDGTLRTGTHEETHNEKRRFGLFERPTLPYVSDSVLARFFERCKKASEKKIDALIRVGEDEDFDRFKKYARGYLDRYSRGPAARKRST